MNEVDTVDIVDGKTTGLLSAAAVCLVLITVWPSSSPCAQQAPASPVQGKVPASPLPPRPQPKPAAPEAAETLVPGGTATTVPKGSTDAKAPQGSGGQVAVQALLAENGHPIEQGLTWRVFHKQQTDGKHKLATQYKEANPILKLPAGDYLVIVAYGRAHLTREITVKPGESTTERFVLNAGGLRLTAVTDTGDPIPAGAWSYDIFADERDQSGNRTKIIGGARGETVVRLNAGIYHVVSTYGDANAIVRSDITVLAGKQTEATVTHAAAKVTFKLVAQAGGEALADIHWIVKTPRGIDVKKSVGALPTHTLAPGTYTVTAKTPSRDFHRNFTVKAGETVQVEVVMQ
ncbi:MAG: hypothetical protein ACREC6_04885 [Hyphomicrobiaceae bacterium]